MSLYDFDEFNKKHIGEHYVFVWNDGKEKPESYEAYYMKWNGSKHEVYLESYGKDEAEALSNMEDKLEVQLVEHLTLFDIGKNYIDNILSNHVGI